MIGGVMTGLKSLAKGGDRCLDRLETSPLILHETQ